MGNPRKFIACALALTMAVSPLIAGCGKKPRSNPKVEADSDWYNVTKVTLESEVDFSGVQFAQTKVLGKAGDCYVISRSCTYPIPYDVDPDDIDYREYVLQRVESYDTNGELVSSVDLFDAISSCGLLDEAAAEISFDDYSIWESEITDNVLSVLVSVYNDQTRIWYKLYIDPATGDCSYERSEGRTLPPGVDGTLMVTDIGRYSVEQYITHDEFGGQHFNILAVKEEEDIVSVIDLNEQLPNVTIMSMAGYMDAGDGKVLCAIVGEDTYGPYQYLTIDTAADTVTLAEDDTYSWLDPIEFSDCSYFDEIGNVMIDTHGISKIDLENSEISEVLSFDSCNINRSDVASLDVVSCTEEEIVLMGAVSRTSGVQSSSARDILFIKLDKAESNPNAGKTILTAATTGTIGYAMSEAVCVFNETDPDYFITFDPKYEVDQYMDMNAMGALLMPENEYVIYSAGAYSQLTDQLTIDILAGEGPDIIFDSSRLSHLNTDDYLLDLSDKINTDGLFGNIVEASKTDGKLYQIPLAFGVTGIVTGADNVASGQTGFTFDEYGDFVSTVCNGKDPLAMNQTEFFIRCLATMSDLFYTEDGKIDYDNEAFRALAEFTEENIFPTNDLFVQDTISIEDVGASYFQNGSFISLLDVFQSDINGVVVLGIPSIDGRGPLASVGCSVAVSSQSVEQEGCLSFIDTLLSSEIQKYYAYDTGCSPISVDAFDSVAAAVVDDYNDMMSFYEIEISPAELSMMHVDTTRIDAGAVDTFREMIGSISGVESGDVAVDIIIREEMPAYFRGQKTLDEVIPVLENRVQTFLDERD